MRVRDLLPEFRWAAHSPQIGKRCSTLPNAHAHLADAIRWPWTEKYSDVDMDEIAALAGQSGKT